MSEILSQSEIESLLSSLSGDPPPGAPSGDVEPVKGEPPRNASAKRAPRTAYAYEVYDFRRPDKFSKEQLRTLQMLHETFARMAGSSLSAYLRSPINVDLISLEQIPYEEYLRSINQSVFAIMSIPPLNGQAVLEVEFSVIFTIIDRLLGGPGRPIERAVLTEIEAPLVRGLIERTFGALKSAWEGVVIVNPGIEGLETSAQFVQVAPPSDIVISVLFEVRIGNVRGAMSLCIPYMVLKPVTAKLSAQKWFASSSRKQNPIHRKFLAAHIHAAPVECSVELGRCRLSVRDFLSLKSGDVLRLNQRAEKDILMLVSQQPKFEGRPALNGKKLVYNVTGPYIEI